MSRDSHVRPRRRGLGTRRTRAVAVGSAAALALIISGISASALVPVKDDTIFELDNNALDGLAAGDDWANIDDNTAGTDASGDDSSIASAFEVDPAGDTIFTGGGSKDDLDITGWRHSTGSVPPKDEITNAYAAAYTADDPADETTDLLVYFGMDRFATNGAANVGFWFLQDEIPDPLPADGTFGSTQHQDGDVLVLSEFTKGGAVPGIQVYEWNPDEATTNGTLKLLFSSDSDTTADCDDTENVSPKACATTNAENTPSPWSYDPKFGEAGVFGPGAFFEGGVNLSELFPGQTPCFSSFLAETRSSPEPDATLKDFVAGSFPLCDAAVTIAPDATNGIGESHTFTVSASKTFAGGSPTPAPIGHADVTLTHSDSTATVTVDTTGTTCHVPTGATGETHTTDNLDDNGQCTVTFTSDTAGTVTGHAKVTINAGTVLDPINLTAETDDEGLNSDDAVKTFVDGTLRWLKHDGDGVLLGGATFEVCRVSDWVSGTGPGTGLISNVTSGTEDDFICTNALKTVVQDDTPADGDPDVDLTPDADADAGELQLDDIVLGRYRIVETTAPTGYVKDSTPRYVDLTLTSPSNVSSPPTFVNLALYKLIVLTCNTATEELVQSDVDVDTTPDDGTANAVNKKTLVSTGADPLTPAQQAALCGLGGANYDDLRANDYTAEVELPDAP